MHRLIILPGCCRKDLLKLVLISSVIAFPIAWWVMHKWLEDFAYRVSIKLVDIFCIRNPGTADRSIDSRFPGNKSRSGESGKEFENRIKRTTICEIEKDYWENKIFEMYESFPLGE